METQEPYSPPSPGAPPPAEPNRRGWFGRMWRGFFSLLAFLPGLAVLILIIAGLLSASSRQEVQEVVLDGKGPDKLVTVSIEGALMRGGEDGILGSGQDMVGWTIDALQRARNDAHVKGVLLEINSPGGGITEADEICHEIDLVRGAGKKVVAFFGDVAASGGYYIATGADEIMALPTTLTGSIGVISTFPDVSQLCEKFGFRMNVIKSGAMKDIGDMFRPMRDDERALLQDMVNRMYERFLDKVWEARKEVRFPEGTVNDKEYWRRLADGRIFTADEAYQRGLVDTIGYHEDAVEHLRTLAGLKDGALVEYRPQRRGVLDLLTGAASRSPSPEAAWSARRIVGQLTPRMMALWTGR